MKKRYGRKTDHNQKEIVRALKAIGCNVFQIDEPFDLLIDYRKQWMVLEVKNKESHAMQKGGGLYTKKQLEIIPTLSAKLHTVHSIEEAIDAVTAQ